MRRALPLMLLAIGCGSMDPNAPDETEPTLDHSSVSQGLVTCSYRQDTGYTNGNPFTITVVDADGKPVEVATANAYSVMQAAAAAQGVNLVVVSGFRTMAEQQYLYSCYTHCNCNNCNLAAVPGTSNHQSGHALDLNTSAGGVYNWLTANGATYGFHRTVPSEIWHWEWWGGGPGGGPCGNTDDNCTNAEAQGCGAYGCGCVDHQCNGGFCPGSGCSAQHTTNCGAFGCGCADGKCAGAYCPGSGCTGKETLDCSKVGCGCSDHKCAGGAACAGSGCTAREAMDCGAFGCNCADHQCSGGFCPGTGCTGKEAADCSAQSCGCVDHKCSGGAKCDGSGSTARNAKDCGTFGCGSVDGQCAGGTCPGSGCTAKQTSDCAAMGQGCVDQKCSNACTWRETHDCSLADAGCAMGACTGGVTVDAGTPGAAPGGELGGPDQLIPGDTTEGNPAFDVPVVPKGFTGPGRASGGCSSAPAGALFPLALLLLATRRRRQGLRPNYAAGDRG